MSAKLKLSLVVVFAASVTTASADDDTVEEALRELRASQNAVHKRLDQFEERLRRIESALERLATLAEEQQVKPQPPKRTEPTKSLRRRSANPVNEVFRLLRSSPEKLLRDIHEREDRLRKRPFPAEVWPTGSAWQ